MKLEKNSPVPVEIQLVQKYLIAGFMQYGASEYKWILSKNMFGMYWDIFEYLIDTTQWTPEYWVLLSKIDNVHELYDLWSEVYTRFDLPRYAKQLFEYYVTINQSKSIGNIENIKKIFDRIDFISTGNKKSTVHDLFLKVEWEIEIAKERWDKPLWFETWIQTIDKHCEWLQAGTVMTINAYSNTGKSKLSYFICNNILKQWKRIVYLSLEVTAEKVLLNLLSNWYKKDYNTIAKWREMIDFWAYYDICSKQLEIIDNIFDIDELVRYTELSKPDVLIIDFLQNISQKWSTSEYERLTSIAMQIQKLAIKNNIAILDLSQISNEGTNYKVGWMIPSKWSGALVASSDVGLMLYKRDDQLKLAIAKNKFWQNSIETTLEVDFSKWNFVDRWESIF